MEKIDKLQKKLQTLNIDKKNIPHAVEKMNEYMEEILMWNKNVNLTNITDREEFIDKHYLDSIVICNDAVFKNAKNIIDVGTGGGFPGVPLAILFPEKDFVLLDSLQKRIHIINALTKKLNLHNITAIHGRAEDIGRNEMFRDKFDLAISRAVANLASLTEITMPFVRAGGYFFSYKGNKGFDELDDAKNAIEALGGDYEGIVENAFNLKNNHIVFKIKKNIITPDKYPRKPGIPIKKPIR